MTHLSLQSTVRQLSLDQVVAVRAELLAIQTSSSFSTSKRCQDFLGFIVEHALAGEFECLTERFLGAGLFGRAIDYETATDSIVRVRASDVRRRLGEYYSGKHPPRVVRIGLVAGGYVPEFHWVGEGTAEFPSERDSTIVSDPNASLLESEHISPASEIDKTTSNIQNISHNNRVKLWSFLVFGLIAAIGLAVALRPRPSNFDRFWQPILEASSSPVLDLPTTSTFQLNLDSMRTLNHLDELKPGESLRLGADDVIAFHDWHVSLPVLQAALSLSLALQQKGKVPLVRIGADLRRDELRGHPIIAVGSFSNPWTEENVSGLRFTFDRGASDREQPRIRDTFNAQRSWSLPHTYPEAQGKDYAIITRTFDPVTHVAFVSLAGLHSFGNQIAAEFVSQDSSWNELARRAPKGWEKMNLQIVLEADVVGTTPGSPRVLDVYFWR
jgi:hypothetical protein